MNFIDCLFKDMVASRYNLFRTACRRKGLRHQPLFSLPYQVLNEVVLPKVELHVQAVMEASWTSPDGRIWSQP